MEAGFPGVRPVEGEGGGDGDEEGVGANGTGAAGANGANGAASPKRGTGPNRLIRRISRGIREAVIGSNGETVASRTRSHDEI
jgi:hypothetical protein|tara:strand:+ start:3549 stop:3797 length:249 start_codon:yes stop_codon:yes gene_type:complete|mmetsp:Transcript_12633/g.41997  ORF Transcript_12633/g.41997 Transcript_12633/m.41997 type:complete len:83 (+) Transcript_12633:1986-2234(+)